MRVRALTHGAVQGHGFRPGEEFELEERIAEPYLQTSQLQELPPVAEAALDIEQETADEPPADQPARPVVQRGGRRAEAATARRGVRR
jgi:hypothetical protein